MKEMHSVSLARGMRPRRAPRLAKLIAVTLTAGALAGLFDRPAAAAPPNVVLIISDDQAWTDYGFMGHDAISTPHLDRLARQSALFPRGYVPSSLCRASLMSIITGLYPHQHGVTGNDPPGGTDRREMLQHVRRSGTLPKMLAPLGYRSLQTGKWWEGSHQLGGFTHGMTHGDPARGGRHGDEGLTIGRGGLGPIFDFIAASEGRPFFVWYAPFLPHQPHNPPPKLLEKYAVDGRSPHVARYYAMCEWFDQTCGELLAYLDEHRLAKNTLVVYVTDNGWIQDPDSRAFAPRSKRSPNEGGIRTPIMLRWPGVIEPATYDQLVSSIDLAPTILAACGAEARGTLPGENHWPLVKDKQPLQRTAVFGEIFAHDVADIDQPAASLQYRWCVDGPWKLILPTDGAAELYNLADDPHETSDLAAEQLRHVRRLTEQLDAWWTPGSAAD